MRPAHSLRTVSFAAICFLTVSVCLLAADKVCVHARQEASAGRTQQAEISRPIEKTLDEIKDVYANRITQLEQTDQALGALATRFDQEIRKRKKEDLFKRNQRPLGSDGWESIKQEIKELQRRSTSLFTAVFWLEQTHEIRTAGTVSPPTFVVLLGIVYFLLLRFRRYLLALGKRPVMASRPWGAMTLNLTQKSLPLLGITLFVYIFAQVRLVYAAVPLVRVVVHVLTVLLFCQWALDMLKARQETRETSPGSAALLFRLRVVVPAAGVFAIAYVALRWLIGGGGAVPSLLRISFEAALLAWSVSFWKMFRRVFTRSIHAGQKPFSVAIPLVSGMGYCIAVTGLLLELAGYGRLALYWYTSWGRTLVVVSWASLLLLSLREWDTGIAGVVAVAHDKGEAERKHAVKWLFSRLAWLTWACALFVSLILAWGGTRGVFMGLARGLNYPIEMGGMRISLMGFVYAILILLVTHAFTRLWRPFLRNRILSDSGLDLGVQESITTITVYLVWGIGAIVALNAMGLSATSIAVAFGALSIGLGFGLQNIFNNFVSGLILLFERPIQIGDVVQINENWGTVTEINVRSTVVQTFDNASLIIPNSDMISNQVINWSFKDPRLRRVITVGVAYGSPTEMVRDTLLEVALDHPRVLKRPAPDVLFDDFADSALTFKLRIWTTIEHFLTVETDLRFRIDQVFREKKIIIAFPQRDVHLHLPEGLGAIIPSSMPPTNE